ncbi:hypothetical protein HF324_24635 [Chitinophaga oryzae]|uniref:SIR2-like domain-containing protein n=1 Tax=Chitinophaga oryzae TaxID=2725414 RepID=A0AAE6ZKM2_9BACT|nr:hypothetical protein [Chitinophaga oryzae]QJB34332.1 hypothetical protein HF329_24775 [Chitinophaga oryzae]QJB40853.1 hypothetical protein HF324_24635 [Chitinophaga oryzae]
MNNLILLIGNDINNISSGQSWKDLLQDIITFCHTGDCVELDDKKPFPLLYEEVFLTAIKREKLRERELKAFIAIKAAEIKANGIHAAIRALKPAHILTTNYEFTLEGRTPYENTSLINEKFYSIFRRYTMDDIHYWHIHGDCLNPMSINLGFEHYGGQLQLMRNYVVSGTFYSSKEVPKASLLRRIHAKQVYYHSWIDFFFTHDIHIFGLSLDFVETDLWWLLTYRARQKFHHKNVPVHNTLYYYIPEELVPASKFKLDLLTANDVKVISLPGKDKLAYYTSIIQRIGKRKSS